MARRGERCKRDVSPCRVTSHVVSARRVSAGVNQRQHHGQAGTRGGLVQWRAPTGQSRIPVPSSAQPDNLLTWYQCISQHTPHPSLTS
jgi:hypothetical protein